MDKKHLKLAVYVCGILVRYLSTSDQQLIFKIIMKTSIKDKGIFIYISVHHQSKAVPFKSISSKWIHLLYFHWKTINKIKIVIDRDLAKLDQILGKMESLAQDPHQFIWNLRRFLRSWNTYRIRDFYVWHRFRYQKIIYKSIPNPNKTTRNYALRWIWVERWISPPKNSLAQSSKLNAAK